MDARMFEWIIFAPLILGLLLISWWATTQSENRLNDPTDDRTVYLDQLPHKLALFAYGIYKVTIFRQSGNIHAEQIVTGTAEQALSGALATLRRAKIDAVHILMNNEKELHVSRLFHDHRGSNEGRKVGRVTIALIEPISQDEIPGLAKMTQSTVPSQESEPSVKLEYIGITCDCGARFEVPNDRLHAVRVCNECGKDATLSGAQILQIQQAIADARKEVLARHRAGETDIQVERQSKLKDSHAELSIENITYEATREAVTRLGYLKSQAIPTILHLIENGMDHHPRALATAYRRDGEQLSKEEKKTFGIRGNAFMARHAFDELTDKGRASPLLAHEITLLRAVFTKIRFDRLTSHGLSDELTSCLDGYKYDTLNPDCPFCSRVDGKVVAADKVEILPAADCQCETSNYMISPQLNWLKDI